MSKHIDKTQSARQTQPIETRKGLLKAYEDIKKWLTLGESQGRLWIYEKANSYWKDNPVRLPPAPNDEDIYELHRVMFSALFDWAGQTRQKDVGPGGRVFVRYYEVPVQLKYRFENLQARVSGLAMKMSG
ncbi:MAG: hypothetical protein U5L04_09585 [Trueperaceae bacterium]|nr:hypothetical protein [Trueperaceae bacterium]